MGIQDLQSFLESNTVEGGAVSVDLLRIARNISQRPQQLINRNKNRLNPGNKLKLVLDAECCLDRLYGGYFSDWACGGQWNRTVQFLSLLINAVEMGNIELAVIFNGALEQQRMSEWTAEQNKIRQRVNMVLKHINTKGTPPPKVWWCPPTCLRTVLRMALRHLNITVLCSMDDHHQEVIAYCRENCYHGLVADDAEYAAFDPPRYFSSENLKLTYKGSLETKEFMVNEMTKVLNLSHEQLCVLAALLGNYLLSENDLVDVYKRIGLTFTPAKPAADTFISTLAEYVRGLPAASNLDQLVTQVLGSSDDWRAPLLRQSVQYYLNGTADGFLKYRTATTRKSEVPITNKKKNNSNVTHVNNEAPVVNHANSAKTEETDLDTSGFASETTEREQKSLEDYKMATANAVIAPDIVINTSDSDSLSLKSQNSSVKTPHSKGDSLGTSEVSSQSNGPQSSVNGTQTSLLVSSSSSGASSMSASPRHVQEKLRVSVEVMRTATERHQKGLMSPHIYHTLVSNEVRLPVIMEDEHHREFPPAHLVFRPIRQKVYAILFNLHHMCYLANKTRAENNSEGNETNQIQTPEVIIREWTWSKTNSYVTPEKVRAEQLGWAVPTIQRLWFGSTVDDKRRRLRAFLTCLNSDSPLILNPSYVPQHMLILACVLRYIMSYSDCCVLRKQELDAFIAQAFAPELMNSQYLQELTLPLVTSRGVQLAALFMQGVETALLANDACGAPIPWLMSCPWLYFDGKLFHHTLARAAVVKNLLELCENHIDRVVKVERMRKAILEGIDVQFAKPPLPLTGMMRAGFPPPNCLPPVNLPSTRGPGGMARRPVPARGGQLQVAGVVVGQWGANYGFTHPQLRPQMPANYGNMGRGRGINPNPNYHPHPPAGRGFPVHNKNNARGPSWPVNKKMLNNKKKNVAKKPKERRLTVQLQSGKTVLASEVIKSTKETESTTKDKPATPSAPSAPATISVFPKSEVKTEPKKEGTSAQACALEHKGQGDGPALDTKR